MNLGEEYISLIGINTGLEVTMVSARNAFRVLFLFGVLLVLAACSGDDGPTGAAGPAGADGAAGAAGAADPAGAV